MEKCHNRAVYRYGINRTLCLPRCLSLFGMFRPIYRPINIQPVGLQAYSWVTLSDRLSICRFVYMLYPRISYVRIQLAWSPPASLIDNYVFTRSCTPSFNYRPSFILCRCTYTTWNSLPADVQSSTSLPLFRQRLKTYLFKKSFPDVILF